MYKLSDNFELSLQKIINVSYALDDITLPELLESHLRFNVDLLYEENPKEDIIDKENILKEFKDELYERIMYSVQLARSLNKSINTLEDQIREKTDNIINTYITKQN